jgi:hypothetical protein
MDVIDAHEGAVSLEKPIHCGETADHVGDGLQWPRSGFADEDADAAPLAEGNRGGAPETSVDRWEYQQTTDGYHGLIDSAAMDTSQKANHVALEANRPAVNKEGKCLVDAGHLAEAMEVDAAGW